MMSKEHASTKSAEVPDAEPDKSALPSEVVHTFTKLQKVLKDAPWVGLGAGLTALGAALLYIYFLSIDYVPVDTPAILASSAAVAALALGFMLWLMLCLIAPRWAYQRAGLESQPKQVDRSDKGWALDWLLVSLQLVGLGALIGIFAYFSWAGCVEGWGYLALLSVIFLAAGLIGWFREDRRVRATWPKRVKRISEGAWVVFWSCFPFIALLSFLIARQGVELWQLGLVLTVCLFVVWVNALVTRELPVWALVFVALMLMPAFLGMIPFFLGKPTLFVERVAELAGIRGKEAEVLRVPKGTCSLIQSTLPHDQKIDGLDCTGDGDWGSVKAQVLSSLGERWLLEVTVDPLSGEGAREKLRLSVPGEGVQIVRRIALKIEAVAACHPSRR